jgi:hypothetical protein
MAMAPATLFCWGQVLVFIAAAVAAAPAAAAGGHHRSRSSSRTLRKQQQQQQQQQQHDELLDDAVDDGQQETSAAAAPVRARGHRGEWTQRPLFTPTCQNSIPDSPDTDPTRNICCGAGNARCPAKFALPLTPRGQLPNYTNTGRRDFHHVVDGPLIGNGNIGVAVGQGDQANVSYPWLDLFISASTSHSPSVASRLTGT